MKNTKIPVKSWKDVNASELAMLLRVAASMTKKKMGNLKESISFRLDGTDDILAQIASCIVTGRFQCISRAIKKKSAARNKLQRLLEEMRIEFQNPKTKELIQTAFGEQLVCTEVSMKFGFPDNRLPRTLSEHLFIKTTAEITSIGRAWTKADADEKSQHNSSGKELALAFFLLDSILVTVHPKLGERPPEPNETAEVLLQYFREIGEAFPSLFTLPAEPSLSVRSAITRLKAQINDPVTSDVLYRAASTYGFQESLDRFVAGYCERKNKFPNRFSAPAQKKKN